jgi:Flp pilus assembly protein TadG
MLNAPNHRELFSLSRPSRRGSVLVYSLFMMIILLAMVSLAVDYARVQKIKTECQRSADAVARGALQLYASDGASTATTYAPSMANQTYNPVDANSGISPTTSLTWGYWTASTKTFTAGVGTPIAVQVTVSRTAANGNAVPLTFPLLNGLTSVATSCNVSATAIAVLKPGQTANSTVPGTADIWLSGMPAGSVAGDVDTPSNAAPTLAMNVTPGTVLTFSATGGTGYDASAAMAGPDGLPGNVVYHAEFSKTGDFNGLQNGIQTITAPTSAMIGVFLTAAAPNTVTPPSSGLDYTTAASQNQADYTNLQVQQPFFIGSGTTSSGTVQSFIVPPGATRLYLGAFDQVDNADDTGSLTVVTTQQPQVYLVK